MGRRESPDSGELCKGRRVHRSVRSSRQHDVDLTSLQQTASVENSGHGGGASSVHGVIGALQIQQVGHASRDHVGQFPGHRVFINPRRALQHRIGKFIRLRFG